MFIRKLYELARVTQYNDNHRQQSPQRLGSDVRDRVTDRQLHDGWSYALVSSNRVPEVTVLPICTIYINLLQIAGGM